MGFLDRFKSGPSAPDALTVEVVARLRVLPTVDAADAVDGDTVRVDWAGRAEPATVDLAELRPRWKEAGGFDRIQLLDDFIDALRDGPPAPAVAPSAPPATPEVAAHRPGPATTDDGGWAAHRSVVLPVLTRIDPESRAAVTWPVAGVLHAVVNGADRSTPVSAGDLERWGVGADEVRAAAVANLEAVDPRPEPISPGARAWVPTGPDGLQSSWLVAPAHLLAGTGLTSAIAFVPVVSELVVIDRTDEALVQSIAASTNRIVAEQALPLCPLPFVLSPTGAEPWEPPAGHPAAADVAEARERFPLLG
jgi:hypothetical protein